MVIRWKIATSSRIYKKILLVNILQIPFFSLLFQLLTLPILVLLLLLPNFQEIIVENLFFKDIIFVTVRD